MGHWQAGPGIRFRSKPALAGAELIGPLALGPAFEQEHETITDQKNHWSVGGLFGTYDTNQLQRGFQVFREVCSNCHSARLIAFRTLAEEGGPEFSEAQVKALAAEYEIADPSAEGGKRAGLPASRRASPVRTEPGRRGAPGGCVAVRSAGGSGRTRPVAAVCVGPVRPRCSSRATEIAARGWRHPGTAFVGWACLPGSPACR